MRFRQVRRDRKTSCFPFADDRPLQQAKSIVPDHRFFSIASRQIGQHQFLRSIFLETHNLSRHGLVLCIQDVLQSLWDSLLTELPPTVSCISFNIPINLSRYG